MWGEGKDYLLPEKLFARLLLRSKGEKDQEMEKKKEKVKVPAEKG